MKRQREHERPVAMLVREDERLTSPTAVSSYLTSARKVLVPNRSEHVGAARANIAAHEAERGLGHELPGEVRLMDEDVVGKGK